MTTPTDKTDHLDAPARKKRRPCPGVQPCLRKMMRGDFVSLHEVARQYRRTPEQFMAEFVDPATAKETYGWFEIEHDSNGATLLRFVPNSRLWKLKPCLEGQLKPVLVQEICTLMGWSPPCAREALRRLGWSGHLIYEHGGWRVPKDVRENPTPGEGIERILRGQPEPTRTIELDRPRPRVRHWWLNPGWGPDGPVKKKKTSEGGE